MSRLLKITALAAMLATTAGATESVLVDGSVDWMSTGDVRLATGLLGSTLEFKDGLSVSLEAEISSKAVDYRPNAPIDPLGLATKLDDTLLGATVSLEKENGRHHYTLGASAYEGFRSYSAMWIDEYYRQQYGLGGIPGVAYEEPDPKGYGLTTSYRWEVLPASAYLTISAGYLRDRVAPGYEIEDLGTAFELVRGETTLHTWTGSIAYEGILNKAMRTQQVLSLSRTSTRDLRWSWSGSLNWALGQRWISRTTVTWAEEDPGFEAWSIAQTFEYAFDDRWAVSLTGRTYSDTGQIESANLVSSAAPALDTDSVFVTVRRSVPIGESAISFSIGPYFSRYADTGIGTERFRNLYADRDWWWTRLAFRKEF